MKFKKKSPIFEAVQWFKNGDHPFDYAKDIQGFLNGEPHVFPAATCRAEMWEGQVVRYYRWPALNGNTHCTRCGRTMRDHGWIDTPADGHTVCPGDWIITSADGTAHHPCHPKRFYAKYEKA